MKKLFIGFLLLVTLICQACSSASEQISLAQQNKVASPASSPPTNSDDANYSYLAQGEDIVDRSGKIQMVFMGYLDVRNGKLVSDNDWSVGEDHANIELKTGMQFDVLTCAGFNTQAKLKKYHGEKNASGKGYEWEMEFIPDKISETDVNALTKCREKESNWIRTFAIYPSKAERQKIKIQSEPDLQKVFDSISAQDKKWIASNDPENTGYTDQKKKDPDIEAWTDSDGDGQIDLIEVVGNCNGKSDGNLICMQILHWTNNKWVRVGWLATD